MLMEHYVPGTGMKDTAQTTKKIHTIMELTFLKEDRDFKNIQQITR